MVLSRCPYVARHYERDYGAGSEHDDAYSDRPVADQFAGTFFKVEPAFMVLEPVGDVFLGAGKLACFGGGVFYAGVDLGDESGIGSDL